jgi:hypothetical protein
MDPQLDDEGDACDPDVDGDGLSNDNDNCWYDANPGQENADGDDLGDFCDPCPDVANVMLACGFVCLPFREPPCTWWPIFRDSDGDTIPDECDDSSGVKTKQTLAKKIQLSAESMEVDVEVGPSSYFKVRLELIPSAADETQPSNGCGPGDPWDPHIVHCDWCQDAFPQDHLALLALNDVPSNVRAWVSDDESRSFDSRFKGDTRVFRFHPQGGRKYFLNLAFGPGLEPGERVTFSAMMTAGLAEEQIGPTPSPTPSPPTFARCPWARRRRHQLPPPPRLQHPHPPHRLPPPRPQQRQPQPRRRRRPGRRPPWP